MADIFQYGFRLVADVEPPLAIDQFGAGISIVLAPGAGTGYKDPVADAPGVWVTAQRLRPVAGNDNILRHMCLY